MAVIGGEVRFEILGAIKTVNIPPETGSHKTIRVRGAGITTNDDAGDLYLNVRIDINSDLVAKLRSRWT
jgi:DnaJ-class molecular chaperone